MRGAHDGDVTDAAAVWRVQRAVVGFGPSRSAHTLGVGWMCVYAGFWVTAVYPLLALATPYIGLSFNRMVRQLQQTFRSLQDELEEHKRAEAALRQRETQYRDVLAKPGRDYLWTASNTPSQSSGGGAFWKS